MVRSAVTGGFWFYMLDLRFFLILLCVRDLLRFPIFPILFVFYLCVIFLDFCLWVLVYFSLLLCLALLTKTFAVCVFTWRQVRIECFCSRCWPSFLVLEFNSFLPLEQFIYRRFTGIPSPKDFLRSCFYFSHCTCECAKGLTYLIDAIWKSEYSNCVGIVRLFPPWHSPFPHPHHLLDASSSFIAFWPVFCVLFYLSRSLIGCIFKLGPLYIMPYIPTNGHGSIGSLCWPQSIGK